MNEFTPEDDFESPEPKGAFLPLVLLGSSFALILIFQVSSLLPQRDQLNRLIKQNEQGVTQSRQNQVALVKLAQEFNDVAPEQAKVVFANRGIQLSGGTAPSVSPSPTP